LKENVELHDFLSAKGRIKKVDFDSLVHYVCENNRLKHLSEDALKTVLIALHMRLQLELQELSKQRMNRVMQESLIHTPETQIPPGTLMLINPETERRMQDIRAITGRRFSQIHEMYHQYTLALLERKKKAA
jgi:hypothetical protein